MKINSTVKSLSEAISIKYNNLVYEMKAKGEDVIVLSLGEAYFEIPMFDFQALPFPDLYHYSHSRGIPSLRSRICEYYEKNYGVVTDSSNQILITAGSKIGIYYALRTVLNLGDEVLLLEPFWVSYTEQVKLVGGVPMSVPISTDMSELKQFITPRTKVIVINNPQNPTGRNYSESELQEIHRLATEHDLVVIADEAYSDFLRDDEEFTSFGKIDTNFERTIIVNSISKNFGISGWRIGYLIACEEVIESVLKITQHTMTCAPTVLLMYLDRYFNEIIEVTKPQISSLVVKRDRVISTITELGLVAEPGTSTFYFFIKISPSKLTSIEFCDVLLSKYQVVAVPGIGYGETCDHHIRISIGTESEARIHLGLRRVKELIEETT